MVESKECGVIIGANLEDNALNMAETERIRNFQPVAPVGIISTDGIEKDD